MNRREMLLLAWPLAAQDRYAGERERMVREHIEARGVRGARLLEVLRTTPRHLFVPPQVQSRAYEDRPQPIGYGATISQPYIVAWMTELLRPEKHHRVLEIGTGSGYQAAILAQLVAQVYSIEIVPELAESARETLRRLGYRNVTVRAGDGYQGWTEQAPFDSIILTAAPPQIPDALVRQLKNGGRLVAPEGSTRDQDMVVIDKGADGKVSRRVLGPVSFVPMRPAR